MQELEGAGEDPFLHKEDMGGLVGALLSMMASIHSPKPPRYVSRMYPSCIPHVSRMYPACISHVSNVYLDYLLGYMYSSRILHVSRMSPSYQIRLSLDAFEIHV